MRLGLVWMIACVLAASAQTQPPAARGKAAAKTATASKTSEGTRKAPAKTKPATAARKVSRTGAGVHSVAAHPRQMQPTPERYHEIQEALVAKGYLRPEQATGAWDQSSIDALKRFQAEQKLDATGKITSMSLIALGLGPLHDSAPLPAAPQINPNDGRPDQR